VSINRTSFVRGLGFLMLGAVIVAAAGGIFTTMHEPEPIYPGPGVTKRGMLSDYFPALAGGPGDGPVFVLDGQEPGGTLVLLGGTHPQEVAGPVAAILVIENVRVKKGRVIVIPQANRSGFTHTDPLEAFPHRFEIESPHGVRWFRFGMRLTNPVHQWPDPDVQVHSPSGEYMVGWEARNLNRNYPGRANGRFTERVGHAVTQLIERENAGVVLDMHEAYPEYPIINMIVAHQRAFEIGTVAALMLQGRGIPMDIMASPENLHGLSHREFGDHTSAFALLSETANAAMGRFRGRTDASLVVDGVDRNYEAAHRLGRLFVPFTATGHPLRSRVARNMATIEEIIAAYNDTNPGKEILLDELPSYDAVMGNGIGAFLNPPPRS
jgi:Succinylglutamate desuccinylase / Aspartoacylase family